MAARRYLTRTDVSRLLDVSPATVARWTRQGKLPFVLTLGGQRRYARKDIRELVRRLQVPRRAVSTGSGGRAGGSRPPRGERASAP